MDDAYRKIAPVYDAVTSVFLRGPRRALVDACARFGVRRALDVGCGTGVLAAMMRERVDVVVGLDKSAAILGMGTGRRPASDAGGKSARPAGAPEATPARPFFIQGDAAHPPFAPGSFDALLYALILHETMADADALLDAGFALAPLALILEWRMPERNLDLLCASWVHVIERLAGKEHYRQFRAFMKSGGVRGLARRVGANVLSERALAGNSLVLAVLHRQ